MISDTFYFVNWVQQYVLSATVYRPDTMEPGFKLQNTSSSNVPGLQQLHNFSSLSTVHHTPAGASVQLLHSRAQGVRCHIHDLIVQRKGGKSAVIQEYKHLNQVHWHSSILAELQVVTYELGS
jgi:hypothetical protein